MSFTYSQETFSPITATGGTVYDITIDGAKYRVHEFKTVGVSTLTVSSLGTGLHPYSPGNSANSVEYLVIGGGGGGGNSSGGSHGGGGGGAGGYRCSVPGELSGGGASAESPLILTPQSYTVTVGSGGARTVDGGDSVFHTITAIGGGRGGTNNQTGATGGSGGGGGAFSVSLYPGGSGTTQQGFSGGYGYSDGVTYRTGGGGGGAGGAGQNADNSSCRGGGGLGLESSITGEPVKRAGGGGSSSCDVAVEYGGGVNGTDGIANTGGGGGGRPNFSSLGGSGGSGIVIIRYPIM